MQMRHINTRQTLAFGLLGSVLIAGCDGSPESPAGTAQPDAAGMAMRMPQSLKSADGANQDSAAEASGTAQSARQTVGGVTEIAAALDASVTGASSQALYLSADLLEDRVEFAQHTLEDIDGSWDAILAFCQSSSQNDVCGIPADTLSDEDGELLQSHAITYQTLSDDKYAHSITLTAPDDGDNSSEREQQQIQWSEDRSQVSMTFESNWIDDEGPASEQSHLLYSEGSDGVRVSLRDEFTAGETSFTDFQQLHALNNDQNGIEVITEYHWKDAQHSGLSLIHI